jgi:hypothetical protein
MNHQTIKITEAAREILKVHGYCVDHLWHIEDIHFICEQNNIPMVSDEEAMMIFGIAGEQFDGEAGLCWPQLEKALFTFLHRKAMLSGLCENNPV